MASDDFNRANESLGGGANWNAIEGDFNVVSNHIEPANRGSDIGNIYNAISFGPDQYAEVRVYGLNAAAATCGMGPLVRGGLGPGNNYYRLVVSSSASNNLNLGAFVNTVFNDIAYRTATISDGDLVRLEVEGATLRIFLNGVQLGADIGDSSVAAGYPGVCHSSPTTTGYLDDWVGGELTTVTRTIALV